MGLFSFLGMGGGGNQQIPGLQEWMKGIGQNTNPAFQQLMAQLGMQSGIPDLPKDIYGQLQGQYDRTMNYGGTLLQDKFQQLIGGDVAKSARLGQLGSTGHARAVGDTSKGYMNELMGLHTNTSNEMNNAILALRQMMYGGEMQKMGYGANMIPQLLGLQGQGFGYQVQQNQVNQQNRQGIIDSLLGMGSAIPGIGGWLAQLLSSGGATGGTQGTAGSSGYNIPTGLDWNL